MTNQEIIDRWIADRPATTAAIYRQTACRFDLQIAKPLDKVTQGDVLNYLDGLVGRSSTSKMNNLAVLKSLMSFAERKGYIAADPIRVLKAGRRPLEAKGSVLTVEEVQRLISAAESERDKMLVKLCYMTGTRASELVSIHRRDMLVDADGGGSLRILGKGNKSRVIKLDGSLWNELNGFASQDPHEPVFKSRKGGHVLRNTAFRIIRDCGRKAGVDNVSPVRLRHAHVTHRLDRGGDIRAIKADCGHACLSGTQYYIHGDGNSNTGKLEV